MEKIEYVFKIRHDMDIIPEYVVGCTIDDAVEKLAKYWREKQDKWSFSEDNIISIERISKVIK